ncbi:MAG: tyrosine-protein phosphatase [Acidobacteria bacterium]|nr:tyrosine-protein phosphatase [Acidobacteriota bacterium]
MKRLFRRRRNKADLPNFHRVNENLFRGGQPTAAGIRQLAESGIKTIINFRDARDNVHRERAHAEAHGLRFINFHLSNWFAARDEELHRVIEIIRDPANHPVFIHCKRGADRTGTVVAVYRMLVDGWTAQAANHEAKLRGIGWWQVWMKDYIRGYYRRMKERKTMSEVGDRMSDGPK